MLGTKNLHFSINIAAYPENGIRLDPGCYGSLIRNHIVLNRTDQGVRDQDQDQDQTGRDRDRDQDQGGRDRDQDQDQHGRDQDQHPRPRPLLSWSRPAHTQTVFIHRHLNIALQ